MTLPRRVLTAAAAAALFLGAAAPALAADGDPDGLTASAIQPDGAPIEAPRSDSAKLAQSDPELLASTSTTPTTVMVKLDYDPAASYDGGVDGLAATSPAVTGEALDTSDAAVADYLAYADEQAAAASAAITAAVPSAEVTGTYNVAYGGLSVTLPAADAKKLLAVDSVAAVQSDSLEQVQQATTTATGAATAGAVDNDTSTFIGADKVWPSLGGRDKAGQGVIVGVLDTGIWPEHPMLADVGLAKPAGGPWACDFGDGSDPALGATFACNNKLVGAYVFLDTAIAQGTIEDGEYCTETECSARDADGHGTHTATTAAGSYVEHASVLGTDRGPISGIAPGASVIAYRVCTAAGCYSSDSVMAVQQAILDGVDVINFSISGGASAYTDPVELAFLDAYKAGVEINASAGNSGPGDGTSDHAGPWVTTVGASTSDRSFSSTLTLTAADGATYSKSGSTLTAGVTGKAVVLATAVPGYTGGAYCLDAFAAGSLTDQVVVCERGSNGRVQKGFNALAGGAAGMILYNPTTMDTETDNHFLPAIHLEGPNDELLALLGAHTGVTATWAAGTVGASQGDVMAGFSSRGPVGDFVKPDVTAPGVQILAGNTPTPVEVAAGPPGEYYQAIAGTSMSSPHAAGVAALVRAAHPTWTPGQVKSALMTSSLQSVTNADGTVADIDGRGAGSIRADRAVSPVVTFDVTAAAYAASAADPLHRVDLNLPSIKANPLPGALLTHRTVTNVTNKTQTFSVKATGQDGLRITVSPSSFALRAGASTTLTVLLDGTSTADGAHQGQITLTPRSGVPAVLPVEVVTGDAVVTLGQTCSPTTLRTGGTVSCTVTATNFAAVAAQATVDVYGLPFVLPVWSVGAPATRTPLGARWSGTLSPALPPTITGVTPATSPVGGYLPLSLFNIAPVAGVGDETVTNFTVPAFRYGSEVYTSIGVVSDGYLVVGGGSSEDVNYVPQTLPDPARPNNVLAPYWTDLNPATGGAVRVATLTDGTTTWIVVDYDGVPAYGETEGNQFEVWIQVGDTEGIWYSYGDLGGPSPDGLTVGAENRDGTSGAQITGDPTGEYQVTTAPPTAGGSTSFTYTAKALRTGTWPLTATLRSDQIRATAIETTSITVTRK
jgi:subtilisin family serine protease